MAGKSKNPKSENDYYARQVRRNQILFAIVAVLLILSLTLSAVTAF